MAERLAHDLRVVGSNPAWFLMRLYFKSNLFDITLVAEDHGCPFVADTKN